jgi:hypothetical protein
MGRNRREPTLKAKLAACIRELFEIPYDHAKAMHEDQILALVQFNHIHLHAQHKEEPWVDQHWNLDPMLIAAHRERTAKIDVPQFYKTDRISKEQEAFRRRLLTPRDERPPKKSRWGSRPFPKQKKER